MPAITININELIKIVDIAALRQRVNDQLNILLNRYGITTNIKTIISQKQFSDSRIAIIYIDKKELYVPYNVAGIIWWYTTNKHVEKRLFDHEVLLNLSYNNDEEENTKFLISYIHEAIQYNPELLISDEIAANWLVEVAGSHEAVDENAVKDLLQQVLTHHISISHVIPKISELITNPAATVAEDIIASSRNPEIPIACSTNYLMDLAGSLKAGDKDFFRLVDEGMFYELGIDFPDVKFITDDTVPDGWFKIFINDFESRLIKGLNPGEAIMQATPNALPASATILQSLTHPASGYECFVFVAADDVCAAIKQQVWHPFGFMALHLVYFYRNNANLFFDIVQSRRIMKDINETYPALCELLAAKGDSYFLCRVLRSLIEERVSLRNVLTIYQSIVDFDYVVADGINKIVFDERLTTPVQPGEAWLQDPHNYADFARINLKDYLSSSLTNASYALTVFLLDQQTEKNILHTAASGDDDMFIKNFLQNFEKVIEQNNNTAYPLLTAVEARKKLWHIIRKRFPDIRVISYPELSPKTSITALTRISVNDISMEALS